MVDKAIRVSKPVPKTVASAWMIGLIALLIIKIFEKLVTAFFFHQTLTVLISLSAFAGLYAVGTAGVLMRQKWGIGFSLVITILDMLVWSYTGGAIATASVVIGIAVLIALYFVNKYVFDK